MRSMRNADCPHLPFVHLAKTERAIRARPAPKPRDPKTRESVIEAYLVKRVAQLGGHAYKWVSPGRVGAPDRMVLRPNADAIALLANAMGESYAGEHVNAGKLLQQVLASCVLFVELKATGQKPKPHQLREHERMRALGQTVVVIDSIEQIEALLENT